jgi:phosphoglycolate phosphatase
MGFATAFDLDLTLVDSRASIHHALAAVAASIDEPIVPGRFEGGVRGRLEASFTEWYPGRDAEALANLYREIYSAEAMHLARLLPGALDAIDAARALGPVFVITGKFEPTARLHLEQLACVVDDVIGWRHGPAKTEAMRRLGVSVYVGDQTEDVLAAQDAGAVAVAVATGLDDRRTLEAVGADYVLDWLTEFPAALTLIADA